MVKASSMGTEWAPIPQVACAQACLVFHVFLCGPLSTYR